MHKPGGHLDGGRRHERQPATLTGSGVHGVFNPNEYTADEVVEFVKAHPDQASTVAAMEAAGKGRVTVAAVTAEVQPPAKKSQPAKKAPAKKKAATRRTTPLRGNVD